MNILEILIFTEFLESLIFTDGCINLSLSTQLQVQQRTRL